jgi:hypothetical protein
VARMGDGRTRVLRISELREEAGALVTRDIFTFQIERPAPTGPVEGSHQPTGNVPTLVEDLASRGVLLDGQLFRRNQAK